MRKNIKKREAIEDVLTFENTQKVAKLLLGEDKEFEFDFLKDLQTYLLENTKEFDACVCYSLSKKFVDFIEARGFNKSDLKKRELVVKNKNKMILFTNNYSTFPKEISLDMI